MGQKQGGQVGDSEAFDQFFMKWEPQVRRFLHWMEADMSVIDDSAQETMLAVYRRWEHVLTRENVRSWLFMVAKQQLWRAQTARSRLGVCTDPHSLPDAPSEGAVGLGLRESELTVLEAVRKLPPRQRFALALRWQFDLSVQEIANVMGLSQNSVKTHLQMARGTLKPLLTDVGGAA